MDCLRSYGAGLRWWRLLLLLLLATTVAAFHVPGTTTTAHALATNHRTSTGWRLSSSASLRPPRPSTALSLFFKASEEGSRPTQRRPTAAVPLVPVDVARQWRTGDVQFPCTWEVATSNASFSSSRGRRRPSPLPAGATLTIRPMTRVDLPEIVQLCYDEYGSLASSSSTSWTDGWEDAALRPYVWATLVLKVGVLPWLPTTTTLPSDHVILVASLSIPSSDDNSLSTTQERLVGMAEVSRQPAQPDRNPPAWPIPLVLKEAYCRWGLVRNKSNGNVNDNSNHRTTQGWLTNLLVVPAHRGRGWSKVLVQAAEGVARAWGRSSLHLHCHATTPVPQALYRSLGYRPPCEEKDNNKNAYAWTINAAEPSVAWQSSIYLFGGVPLLYMCKSLELEKEAD